jgi:integrase
MMVERELISDNPFKRIKKVPQDIGKNHAFTWEEKTALIKLLKERNRWLYYFVSFMYHGFIRRNELIQLRISDIKTESNTIVIRSEVSKNRKQEGISITEGLKEVICEMRLDRYPSDWYIFGIGLNPGPRKYAKGDSITIIHKEFLKELNIPPEKTLYSWKHTGVCDYFNLIKDPYALMRQLRHHDLTMTMIYLKSLGLTPNDQIINARLYYS